MAYCTRHKYTDLLLGIYRELIASRRCLAVGFALDADLAEGHSVQSKKSANCPGLSQGPDFGRQLPSTLLKLPTASK